MSKHELLDHCSDLLASGRISRRVFLGRAAALGVSASMASTVAATAVHLGYRVATRDRRSFHRVDGLAVEYW